MLARRYAVTFLVAAVGVSGCSRDAADADGAGAGAGVEERAPIEVLAGEEAPLSAEELERGRLDAAWRRVVQMDTTARRGGARSPERWADLSSRSVNESPMFLPLAGDAEGASVLRVQILLDRALFSPGVIDGRWGKNTEKAIFWLQKREGLPATGEVDSATFARMTALAGSPGALVREHVLSEDDVSGPFVDVPDEIYEAHKLECTCYESPSEKLSERFHVTPSLLQQLNPGVDLNGVKGGDRLSVPAVRAPDASVAGQVAEIVVSVGGFYLHANDARGRLLYHFPATLGSGYDPGDGLGYKVTGIAPDPWWNLQPRLLHTGDPTRANVQIPPGPNSSVGNMWIGLSKRHFGIHGTAEPQSIGYATSSGCVRLTNWDANFLGGKLSVGIPVVFKDIPPGRTEHPSHGG